MTDSQLQSTTLNLLITTLRNWRAGGRVCVFGTTMPDLVAAHITYTDPVFVSEREYDLADLHHLERGWDMIIVDRLLEHSPYPWIAVEQIRTHLKPGGVALFLAASVESQDKGPNDLWRLMPAGLRALCASYADVEVGTIEQDENVPNLPLTWAAARVHSATSNDAAWQPPVEEDAAEGGPWQIDDFADTGGDQWVEKRVCDYIASSFAPETALDVGCGAGLFVKYLNDRHIDTWGIEAADLQAIFPLPDKFIRHDLRYPLDLQQTFDLVLCLEVAEHIDAAFEQVLFETIRRHSKRYLLFSAATLGQEGHGHINLHPEEYWFTRLRELGYRLLIEPTNICRALCVHPWYAKNISFWDLSPADRDESNDTLPGLIEQPDSYVRRLEDDYNQQRAYIDSLQQKHTDLVASWESQRQSYQELKQHADRVEEEYGKLRLVWEEQQRVTTELTKHHNELRESWEQQRSQLEELTKARNDLAALWQAQKDYIADLEQRHTTLSESWEAQQQHIAALEQQHATLVESWEAQQQYIADIEQQQAQLAESWNAQQHYITNLEQQHSALLAEWNTQHQYIEEMSQRHSKLIEEWDKQREYINELLYKK